MRISKHRMRALFCCVVFVGVLEVSCLQVKPSVTSAGLRSTVHGSCLPREQRGLPGLHCEARLARRGRLYMAASLQTGSVPASQSARLHTIVWTRLAAIVRAVLLQAALLVSLFFFSPTRAHAGLVFHPDEASEGVNVVYMDESWNQGQEASGPATPMAKIARADRSTLPLESTESERDSEMHQRRNDRLAAIKTKMISMFSHSHYAIAHAERIERIASAQADKGMGVDSQVHGSAERSPVRKTLLPIPSPFHALPHVTMYTRGGGGGGDYGLAQGTPSCTPPPEVLEKRQEPHQTTYSRGVGGGDHMLVEGTPPPVPYVENMDYDDPDEAVPTESRYELSAVRDGTPPASNALASKDAEAVHIKYATAEPETPRVAYPRAAYPQAFAEPWAECDSDIHGLQTYTESVRFLETTLAESTEILKRQHDAQAADVEKELVASFQEEDTGAHDEAQQNILSVALKLALTGVVAYGNQEDLLPAIKYVGQQTVVIGKSLGETAMHSSKAGALAAGNFVGGHTATVSGHTARVSKNVGGAVSRVVSQTASSAGKLVGAQASSAATYVNAKAESTLKYVGAKAASTKMFVIGETPEKKVAVVQVAGEHPQAYKYLGDQNGGGAQQNPGAEGASSSFLCGLESAAVLLSSVAIVSAGIQCLCVCIFCIGTRNCRYIHLPFFAFPKIPLDLSACPRLHFLDSTPNCPRRLVPNCEADALLQCDLT